VADVQSNIQVNLDASQALAQLKALQRQLATFHSSVATTSTAAAKAQASLQSNLINSVNATGKFAASLTTIKSSADSFTDSLERNKFSTREYFRYAGGATKTFGRLFKTEFDTIGKVAEERVKTMQTQYIKMGRDANGAIRAIAVKPLALDMNNLATKTALAAQKQQLFNQLMKQGSTNLLNFGKNTQWAGRQLMVGFTVPLTMLGMTAGKTFMALEKQAIRFKRVYGEMFTSTAETERAFKDIELLAKSFTKYGVAVEKTLEMAADAAATGKMGADLMAQVAQATRLAVLGGVEQEEALRTTISLTNAFGIAADQLKNKIDFLNAVENQTVLNIEDLTIAVPKAGPVIRQLGGDVEDLAFFMTAMKEGGINASEGANALKSGLASLINPSKKASAFLLDLGVNINGIVESNKGNIKDTVIQFAQALDTLAPLERSRAIEQLFGKFQFSRLSTLFQNITKDGTQAARTLGLAGASVEELAILSERELRKIEDATGTKFKKSIEDLKVSLMPVGKEFIKALTPIVEFIGKILEKFNGLSDGAKARITKFIAIVGIIGPAVLMTFGLVANGVANILKLFVTLRKGFFGLGGQSKTLGQQIQYMSSEQIEAATVAASLNQAHSRLRQTFLLEAASLNTLTTAYQKGMIAANNFARTNPGMMKPGFRPGAPKKFADGGWVPGTGNKDTVPAVLTPGEFVVKKDAAQENKGFLQRLNKGGFVLRNDGTGTFKNIQDPWAGEVKGGPKYDPTLPKFVPGSIEYAKAFVAQQALEMESEKRRIEFEKDIRKNQSKRPTKKPTPVNRDWVAWAADQDAREAAAKVAAHAKKVAEKEAYRAKQYKQREIKRQFRPGITERQIGYAKTLAAKTQDQMALKTQSLFLGLPNSNKQVQDIRQQDAVLDQIDNEIRSGNLDKIKPTNFGKMIAESTGRSFPVPGIGGIYERPDGSKVFVKPFLDEKSAVAEERGTTIQRDAHDIVAPNQKLSTMIDPNNPDRKLIVLQSPFDPRFAEMTGEFTESDFVKQTISAIVRGDKDLSKANVSGDRVSDVGTSGVFATASAKLPGERQFGGMLPVRDQAMVNFLGVNGGAKRHFADATRSIAQSMTPAQYERAMLDELDRVIPKLKTTIAGFGNLTPEEKVAYAEMVQRAEDAKNIDWKEIHKVHVEAKVPKIKKPKIKATEKAGKRGHRVSIKDPAFRRLLVARGFAPRSQGPENQVGYDREADKLKLLEYPPNATEVVGSAANQTEKLHLLGGDASIFHDSDHRLAGMKIDEGFTTMGNHGYNQTTEKSTYRRLGLPSPYPLTYDDALRAQAILVEQLEREAEDAYKRIERRGHLSNPPEPPVNDQSRIRFAEKNQMARLALADIRTNLELFPDDASWKAQQKIRYQHAGASAAGDPGTDEYNRSFTRLGESFDRASGAGNTSAIVNSLIREQRDHVAAVIASRDRQNPLTELDLTNSDRRDTLGKLKDARTHIGSRVVRFPTNLDRNIEADLISFMDNPDAILSEMKTDKDTASAQVKSAQTHLTSIEESGTPDQIRLATDALNDAIRIQDDAQIRRDNLLARGVEALNDENGNPILKTLPSSPQGRKIIPAVADEKGTPRSKSKPNTLILPGLDYQGVTGTGTSIERIVAGTGPGAPTLNYQKIPSTVTNKVKINNPNIQGYLRQAMDSRQSLGRFANNSLQGVQRLAKGGSVSGYGEKDTVPALLTPGEFVVNKKATQENGPILEAMNSGKVQYRASGTPSIFDDPEPIRYYPNPYDEIGKSGQSNTYSKPVDNPFADIGKSIDKPMKKTAIKFAGTISKKLETSIPKIGKNLGNVINEVMADRMAIRAAQDAYDDDEYDEPTKQSQRQENPKKGRVSNPDPRLAQVYATQDRVNADFEKEKQKYTKKPTRKEKRITKRQQRIEKFEKKPQNPMRGQIASGGLMAAGMGMGMISATSPDSTAGKISSQLAPMAMAGSMIAPMIGKPSGAVLGPLAALGGALIMLRMQFDKAQDAALELGEATGTSTKAIQSFAEFAGKATGTERMDRKRLADRGQLVAATGKTTFGEAFVQSEAGQKVGKNFQENLKKNGRAQAQSDLKAQLVTSVMSGALNAEQAQSIAANIGASLGDAPIGIQIAGELQGIFGKNGRDITKDGIEIQTQLMADSSTKTKNSITALNQDTAGIRGMDSQIVTGGMVAAGMGLGAAAGATLGTMIAGPIGTGVGLLVGTAIGGIAGGVSAYFANKGNVEKIGKLSGAAVADATAMFEQSKQLLDAYEAEYNQRREQLVLEGKLSKVRELDDKYIKNREKITNGQIKQREEFLAAYKSTTGEGRKGFDDALDKQMTRKYKGTAQELYVTKAKDDLRDQVKAGTVTSAQAAALKVQVNAGELGPGDLSKMFQVFSSPTDIATMLTISAKFGGEETAAITDIVSQFRDQNGNPIPALNTKFALQMKGKTDEQAQEAIKTFQGITALGGVMNLDTEIDYILKNENVQKEISKDLQAIKDNKGKPFTTTFLNTIDARFTNTYDSEYFKKLSENEKAVYVSTMSTLLNIKDEVLINDPGFLTWQKETGPLGGAQYSNLSPPAQLAKYRDAYSQKVTSVSVDTSLATDGQKKTGGGQRVTLFDETLKKLKQVQRASVNAMGGEKELIKQVMGKNAIKYGDGEGVDQKLLKDNKVSGEFLEFVDSLGPEGIQKDLKKFVTIGKNGIATLTQAGKALQKAFGLIKFGEKIKDIQLQKQELKNRIVAMRVLLKLGFDNATATSLAAESATALAIATGQISVQDLKNYKKDMKGLTDLQTDAARIQDIAQKTGIEGDIARAEGLKKIVEAQEALIEGQYLLERTALDTQKSENDYGLDLIAREEDKVNEVYDKQIESLQEINRLAEKNNALILTRMSLADALASGDIGAASAAMQEYRNAKIQQVARTREEALQKAKENAIKNITVTNSKTGKISTREDLEKLNKEIDGKLADIDEKIRLQKEQLSVQLKAASGMTTAQVNEFAKTGQLLIDAYGVDAANKMAKGLYNTLNGQAGAFNTTIAQGTTNLMTFIAQLQAARAEAGRADFTGAVPKDPGYLGVPGLNADGTFDPKTAASPPYETSTPPSKAPAGPSGSKSSASTPKTPVVKVGTTPTFVSPNAADNAVKKAAAAKKPVAKIPPWVKFASGGIVPKYMASGGLARGTDTVPAMLTPGEYVINKDATQKFGPLLSAINSPTFKTPTSSNPNFSGINSSSNITSTNNSKTLYNYNLSVNVSNSNANPNDIARTVINQIKMIEDQRIRRY